MTLTSSDTVWIMFKKRLCFTLIQIVTVMQVPASQFVVARRPCSLLNGNDSGYSVTNGFVKWKWSCPVWWVVLYLIQTRFYLIATQLMVINVVEFWLCNSQRSKSMANMVNTVMHFRFDYVVTVFPYWYLIKTGWILCIISTAYLSLLLIKTTWTLSIFLQL